MSEDNPFDGATGGDEEFSAEVADTMAPEGIAIVQLLNVESAVSKSSGNKMFVWEFSLCEYLEPAAKKHSFYGDTMKVFTSLSTAAAWKLAETLNALGIEISDKKVNFKKSEVVGVICKAVIKHTEFNNSINANIDALAAPDEGAGTKRPMPTLHQTAGAPGDDDIPF